MTNVADRGIRDNLRWTIFTGAAVIAAVMVGSPAAANRAPGDYLKAEYAYVLLHQWGREWATLHPAQQRIVSRSEWLSCAEDAAPTGSYTMAGWKVLDTYRERIVIPGTIVSAESTAVTYRMTLKDADTGKRASTTSTSHVIVVAGRYRWTMEAATLRRCR